MEKFTDGNSIETDIKNFQSHIQNYRAALNDEGVWLFLATLGCWGVTNITYQFIAYAIAMALFGKRLTDRVGENTTFSKIIEGVKSRIGALVIESDERKARLYDLAAVQKAELSTKAMLRNGMPFIICWVFYAASFGFTVFNWRK